jgi:hypothetical protein
MAHGRKLTLTIRLTADAEGVAALDYHVVVSTDTGHASLSRPQDAEPYGRMVTSARTPTTSVPKTSCNYRVLRINILRTPGGLQDLWHIQEPGSGSCTPRQNAAKAAHGRIARPSGRVRWRSAVE